MELKMRCSKVLTFFVVATVILPFYGWTAQADLPKSNSRPDVAANANKDQTAAVQKLLDAAAAKGGGVVRLEAGRYRFDGTISVPMGVSLEGAWAQPHHGILEKGTILEVYGGRGTEEGAFIKLTDSSGVRGVTVVYPEQTLDNIQPYPWTIHGQGMHNNIENVTLVNSYNGICIGPERNELHTIRNVYGCVLRRGIKISRCTDIGRIENVHFNPHYWPRSGHDGVPKNAKPNTDIAVAIKMQEALEAFIFERTDWQYVHNTFVFAAKIGYLFTGGEQKIDACSGQFHGIGADMCIKAVVFDKVQPAGLLISNGNFVTGRYKKADTIQIDTETETIAIHTTERFTGSVQLSNCNFWGFFTNVIKLEGDGYFSLNQSTIMPFFKQRDSFIKVLEGRAHITGTIFKDNEYIENPEKNDKPHVYVGKQAKRVVVAENFAEGGVLVDSEVQSNIVQRDNE